MFVPEKNKLNRFQLVRIPKKREHFARYGFLSAPAASYSGDADGAPMGNKIDVLADMDQYDRYMQQQESKQSGDGQ